MSHPTKWCERGKHFMPHTEFARNRGRKLGLDAYCKPCNRTWHREHQKTEARKNSRKAWAAGVGRDVIRRYHERYPQKRSAQAEIQRAVRLGHVVKPHECSACGSNDRVEAHHNDYARPLEVRWLCRLCHRLWHRMNGQALNANSHIR